MIVEFIIAPAVLPFVYRNMVPDFLIRLGIRLELGNRVRAVRSATAAEDRDRLLAFVQDLKTRPIAEATDSANEQHYEVPPDFYQYSLGEFRKYSSGFWPAGVDSLTQSELSALELVCKRADLRNGQDVLELGCGWGSFTLFAAAKYPRSTFTCVSNSNSQREFITAEAKRRNLSNVRPITADMNDFQAPNTVDRVVSIEMFEHMKNYEELFRRVSTWLNPGGKLFVHIFSHVGQPYHFLASDGWMAQNFFSGGTMPSDDLFLYFQRHLTVAGHWRLNGTHYERTCNEWLKRMDAHQKEVLPVLARTYPDAATPTGAMKRFVMWRLFYMACAELFGYDNGNRWVVSHYLFESQQEA